MEYFEKMVRANQIQKCPITSEEITDEKFIFGPHLAEVIGKTIRRKPKQVDSDRVEIPREFQILHKSVTLVACVFFVNGIPFFITISRKLRFVTVKHMGYRTDNQLSTSLNKVCIMYACTLYNVEVLSMDM